MKKQFTQNGMKAGKETGSLFNMLMSRNGSIPEVGKGATILSWTDRHAYEVMEVSNDKKRVVIQQYHPERTDNLGMSDAQQYKYEKLNGVDEVIVWKWGAWRKMYTNIEFTPEYAKTIGAGWFKSEDYKAIYHEGRNDPQLIEGKTHLVTKYSKINILWGVKDEHYDFSF